MLRLSIILVIVLAALSIVVVDANRADTNEKEASIINHLCPCSDPIGDSDDKPLFACDGATSCVSS